MPVWWLYIGFLAGAAAGVILGPRDHLFRLAGFGCMAAVFLSITLAQTPELGDDIRSYHFWAESVGRASSLEEVVAGQRDPGFSLLLWSIQAITGSSENTSLALPIIGAVLAGISAYSITSSWTLSLTLLLTNRLFIDSVFNYIRSSISTSLALVALTRLNSKSKSLAWLLLLIPVYFTHQKAAIMVTVTALLAWFVPRASVLWLVVAGSATLVLRTFLEFRILPSSIISLEVLRDVSRYQLYILDRPTFPMSLGFQVLVYVALPLLAAAHYTKRLSDRANYFLALAAVSFTGYALLGPELPLLLRILPVAVVVASCLAASIFDSRMYLVRCAILAANFVALVNIVGRGDVITY